MKTELTFAVPTDVVWKHLEYHENSVIKMNDASALEELLAKGVFIPRNLLEDDPSYKQIIPYAVICYVDDAYMFHRTKKQSETRLHNLYSLGVGGHMNPYGDSVGNEYLHHELEREMNEEVVLYDGCSIERIVPVGFINDDTNDVGKVHLGVLYQIWLSNANVRINETEKMTGQWVRVSDLKDYYGQMESWSQIYCDLL